MAEDVELALHTLVEPSGQTRAIHEVGARSGEVKLCGEQNQLRRNIADSIISLSGLGRGRWHKRTKISITVIKFARL